MYVYSGVEQRCMVMSKDQVSVKRDTSGEVETLSSARFSPAFAVIKDDNDDDDDDDKEAAVGMQFATETIVKNFSRCISTSSMIRTVLIHRINLKKT